jgi:HAD superfamily hydrolase (TIGR01490 family)
METLMQVPAVTIDIWRESLPAAVLKPARLAFFDMDHTLLRGHSAWFYLEQRRLQRPLTRKAWLGFALISGIYSALGLPPASLGVLERLAGGNAMWLRDLCESCFQDTLVANLSDAAVARLRQHEQQGDTVVLLSAATQFGVAPVARFLNVAFRCTELEVANGRLTGRTLGEVCYGPGKRRWAARMAQAWGVTLDQCAFYTDSFSDRGLLLQVGQPVAVNPDFPLRALARQRGWEVAKFN